MLKINNEYQEQNCEQKRDKHFQVMKILNKKPTLQIFFSLTDWNTAKFNEENYEYQNPR